MEPKPDTCGTAGEPIAAVVVKLGSTYALAAQYGKAALHAAAVHAAWFATCRTSTAPLVVESDATVAEAPQEQSQRPIVLGVYTLPLRQLIALVEGGGHVAGKANA